MEMNLALYRLPSAHRSSTSSPSGGGPSRRQSLLYREGMVRPCPACPCPCCPCCPCSAPHRDALWVQVVAVGAIIEVDFIECLCTGTNDLAAVVEPVAILGDDDLAQGHRAQELALGWGDGICSPCCVYVDEAKWAGLAHTDGVQSCGRGYCTHPCSTGPVLEAGDGHHVGPVIRFHEDTSSMRAGHMEGCGAVLIGALDAGTRHPLHALAAVNTFLQRGREQGHQQSQRGTFQNRTEPDRTRLELDSTRTQPISSQVSSPSLKHRAGVREDRDGATASPSEEPLGGQLLSAYHPPEP